MTGRNSLHYFYDVSYQCWFASEEAKIYCNNFNSSNAVVCSHLILAYTVWLAIINAVELERNGWCFFFYLYWCCVVIEKNINKKLANIISYQICYKRCLKGKSGRGSNLRRGVQIRCDTKWHMKSSRLGSLQAIIFYSLVRFFYYRPRVNDGEFKKLYTARGVLNYSFVFRFKNTV